MQTDSLVHPINSIAATRVVDQDGIWRPTDRDVRTAPTHDDIENISENSVYCKYIKDLECHQSTQSEYRVTPSLYLDS